MSELASQTLHLVAREINNSLADGRTALESYVEQPQNLTLLDRCQAELHQVQGVLRMLEIYGAALLAEEMEQVTGYLIDLGTERKNQPEALDALMRAMVQLPSYLERVLAGGRDLALVLLPLLNDLRAVRGSALLSEGTLLLLNLKSDRQAQPASPTPGEAPLTAAQWARRLRAQFQTGLIGWIRGERVEKNLEILSAVATRMEQVATTQPVFQLWWVVGALLEALRENGVEGGISVKRLLGLADRELRRLYEQGEPRYSQHPPVELLNNVLYYIARASTAGPRVAAVRASFRLQELLPVDDSIDQERESLSAPSIKLMQTVAAAIREDLGKVKEVLDIYVRRGMDVGEELLPQVSMLKKIGDTLGVLGLGESRARIIEATAKLEAIATGRDPGGEPQLVQIAAALIKVEDRLDHQLVGLILPRRAPEGESEAQDAEAPDSDFQQVQAAVLRECIVNLARVKEYIAQNVGGTLDTAGFDNWPDLVRGIKAGLLMLGKGRAVETLDAISVHLKRVMQPGGAALPPDYLDRLADAVVSVEYYIETLQAGRSDPWYMLDNAKVCLDAMARTPERALPTVPPLAAPAHTRTLRIEPTIEDTDISKLSHPLFEPPVLAAATNSPHTSTLPDPELTKLFIEEATEESQKIAQQFAAWDRNPLDIDPVLSVRRSFHTLKGSGRMVNARQISEFAWSVENLLNRLLDGTLQRSPAVLETLRSAVAMLPHLVEDLASDRPGRAEATALASRAHALASGREALPVVPTLGEAPVAAPAAPLVAPVPPPRPPAAVVVPVAEGPPPPPDPVLNEIYARETAAHVEVVRAWIARESRSFAPHVLTEEIYRACHTLAGSSTMAEVRHGIRLADPLNHWLRKSFDSGVGLDDSDLILLGDCMSAMEMVAGHLDEATGFFIAHDLLRARIARADVELDRRIGEANELVASSHVNLQVPELTPERAAELGVPVAPPESPVTEAAAPASSETADDWFLPDAPPAAEAEPGKREPHWSAVTEGEAPYVPTMVIAREEVPTLFDAPPAAPVEAPAHGEVPAPLEASHSEHFALDLNTATSVDFLLPPEPPMPIAPDVHLEAALPEPAVPPLVPMAPIESAPPPAPPAPPPPPAVPPPVADFDPEIAAIFSEEAVELLEASQNALAAWNAAPHDSSQAAALRRPLHTLKGGARMAGVSAMGQLAHELESLVTRIDNGMANGDAAARAVAQESLDELSRMREQIAVGRPVAAVPALLERIRQGGVETPAPGAPEPAAATPAQPPLAPPVPDTAAGDTVQMPTLAPALPDEPAAAPRAEPVQAAAPVDSPSVTELAEPVATEAPAPAPEPAPASEIAPVVPPAPAIVTVAPAAPATAPVRIAPPPPSVAAVVAPLPPGREPMVPNERLEMARVSAELLDQLLNSAGEVSIARARLEQQLGSIDFNLGELSRTVTRLKEQLRRLEIETEAQILHRRDDEPEHRAAFDPLELDRYSSIQQYSRALAETANDVASIQGLLEHLIGEAQNQLQQQSRTVTELQNGLLRTRMVSLQRHVQRLSRIVRQAAADTGKRAELVLEGATGELDRQVLERMLPPFEHLLRNAVVHGIESPAERQAAGKDPTGQIRMSVKREGAEVIVEVADDGAGMNLPAIRAKGQRLGLIAPDQALSDDDLMQLVLEPGFTTADALTQAAGRGVGMDVVAVEVKKLGGALHMESTPGKGARFTIRLPFTLAISHALVVRADEEYYALPLPTVEGVVRLPRDEVAAHLRADSATFNYGGQKYRLQPLALYVGLEPAPLPEADATIPVVLVRAGEHSTGLVADELIGSREIVVKPVGPQISRIRGISGATILSDGRVVIILDIGALVRGGWRGRVTPTMRDKTDQRTLALVVDDSITVRRVTQRLLERNNMRVLTARDGMDALTLLADHLPDVILLDIEMPRMDGYELAAHVRNDPRLRGIPIIMITSRTGEKHRARAIELGVNDYLGKPYQESELIEAINPLVAKRRAEHPGLRR